MEIKRRIIQAAFSLTEAKMKKLAVVLAISLIVTDLTPLTGLPMESLLTNQRCRCRKQTSDVISASKIRFIEVIPQGIQCRRKEIILTLKNTQKVCVHPNAPWIQLLLLTASVQCNSLTDFSQQRKPTRCRLTNGLKFLSWKATIHRFPSYYYFFVILFFTLLSMFKGCSLKIYGYLWLPSSTSGERVWICAYFDWNSKHELCLVTA
ncbi:C-X-C motif chemokine 9-like isoform X1 [Gopherus flavomarginatus]|uniref:C-X-C motif chemokine 9-like isoform X1 n=1 Tax=Gopherus flavomarginatus TaxID=286002 RepID=UPI0021CBF723|nr:C-X-C motif chemokine 9-like isoform X1 [Gopherus flavomarginatus]